MIVRPKQSWFALLFAWKGSVLPAILPQLAFMAVVSCLAVFTHGRVFGEKVPLNATLLTPFGLTLAIFLGFRNNASYQRFDEARRLWGQLLIASRALTSQMLAYVPDRAASFALADQLVAVVHALKQELRDGDAQQRPTALLDALRARLVALANAGQISDARLWTLDAQLNELGAAIGGCERIASTPIPFVYSVLLHRTVYTYCILLPFGLVDSTALFTPLLSVFLAYTLIALEAAANEVAEPFGLASNALPLDAMARHIERSVLALCGRELPAPIEPGRGYVLT